MLYILVYLYELVPMGHQKVVTINSWLASMHAYLSAFVCHVRMNRMGAALPGHTNIFCAHFMCVCVCYVIS